jgi:hypothetical protein
MPGIHEENPDYQRVIWHDGGFSHFAVALGENTPKLFTLDVC